MMILNLFIGVITTSMAEAKAELEEGALTPPHTTPCAHVPVLCPSPCSQVTRCSAAMAAWWCGDVQR